MDAMRILPSVKHALTSSHSIFNYSNFLAFLTEDFLPSRELLILDEAHLLETEIRRIYRNIYLKLQPVLAL